MQFLTLSKKPLFDFYQKDKTIKHFQKISDISYINEIALYVSDRIEKTKIVFLTGKNL